VAITLRSTSVLIILAAIGYTRLAAAPPANDRRVVAFVDLDKLAIGPILEQRLQAGTDVQWVEREQIEQVLREHKLQGMFAAAGTGDRIQLGRVLKADALVLLRRKADQQSGDQKSRSQPMLEVVVAETKQGLRVASISTPATSDPAADAAELVPKIQAALTRRLKPTDILAAVPPFVSNDLSFKFDYQKTACSKIIEQLLLDDPGVWIVELAEAQAIAKELELHPAEAGITRQLPYLIAGDYRDQGDGADRRVKLTLKLLRGMDELGRRESDVSPEQMPDFLREAALDLLKTVGHAPEHLVDSSIEVQQLAARARELMKYGNWDEAMPVLEACLLLDPSDAYLRRDAIIVSDNFGKRISYNWRNSQALRVIFAQYRRGVEHVVYFGRHVADLSPFRSGTGRTFLDTHFFFLVPSADTFPQDVRAEYLDLMRNARETLLDVVRFRAQQNWGDEGPFIRPAVRTLERPERLDLLLKVILELQDLPGAEKRTIELVRGAHATEVVQVDPEGDRKFLEQLAAARSPEVRAAIPYLKANFDRMRIKPVERGAKAPGSVQELWFAELKLEIEGQPGQFLDRLDGCVSAGDFEVMWCSKTVYIMKQPGKLRQLWAPPYDLIRGSSFHSMYPSFTRLIYDGRYLWAAVPGAFIKEDSPQRLLVIDPISEKAAEFTAADGLPVVAHDGLSKNQVRQSLAIAPIGPGKICVAGSFGRAWLAVATFDPEHGKSVRVFHECREAANPANDVQWASTTVAFNPTYMFTLVDPQTQDRRIIVGRQSRQESLGAHQLLVDPQRESVSMLPAMIYHAQYRENFAEHNGALYYVDRTGPNIIKQTGFPDFRSRAAMILPERGWIFIVGNQVHLVNTKWWSGGLGGPMRLVADHFPWAYAPDIFERNARGKPGKDYDWKGIELVTICQSNRYGLVAVVEDGRRSNRALYQVRLKHGAAFNPAKTPAVPNPKPASAQTKTTP